MQEAEQSASRAPCRRTRCHRVLVAAAALALAAARPGAAEPPFEPDELLVRIGGAPGAAGADTAQVVAADLEVVEDGVVRPVTAVEPVEAEWRLVIYLDLLLTRGPVYRSALLDLGEQARRLTELGSVEIILAGEAPRQGLPPTRDPLALEEALKWLLIRETTEGGQVTLRRDLIDEYLIDAGEEGAPSAALMAERSAELGAAVRDAIDAELELLRRQREALLAWIAEQSTAGPKALLLVTSGFDEEPAAFYRRLLEGGPWSDAAAGLGGERPQPPLDDVASSLAVYGWLTVPYAPPNQGDGLLAGADEDRQEGEDQVETVLQDGQLVDRTTATIDPRKVLERLRRRREAESRYGAQLLTPNEPLQALASATGGEVVVDRTRLGEAIGRLGERRLLRFESGAAGGGPLPVEVRRRGGGGEPLLARRWTGGATPEPVAALRARRFFDDESGEGEIYVSAGIDADAAAVREVVVEVDREGLAESAALRLTVAVGDEVGGSAVAHHRVGLADGQLSDTGAARFVLPLEAPAGEEPLVAVLVEELASGRWGATYASFTSGLADLGSGYGTESLLLPAPKAIHLLAPEEVMVTGPTTFSTVVSQREVTRVDFYLDGERAVTTTAPPYSAVLDLGKLPETHRVEAVAYGDAGELGRDRITVNAGLGAFRVRILRPDPERAGDEPDLVGPVDVEAEVDMPAGRGVERVEFYWKDELRATRFAPPYRQRVDVPRDDPKGFVRVVGYLSDGTSVEDVVFLNSPGSSERLQVDLVQLYVVATDRRGRPVRGLRRSDFKVFEEDEEQELAAFGDAGDQPLTVGLAIDSSASMFVKLPDVQAAAASFVDQLESRRDRAFVVGFGSEPQLARATTSQLTEVLDGLYRLEPDGHTSIWKAVVYSLVQLQGAGGKKALIVYSDGADEDPDFSYRTALEFARRVAAPVYFILSNDEIYRTGGKSLNIRGFLGRLNKLAAEVGGRVFITKVTEDLADVYAEIEEELRSQYLLAYYAQGWRGDRWRRVTVEVDKPGVKARTLAGYFR